MRRISMMAFLVVAQTACGAVEEPIMEESVIHPLVSLTLTEAELGMSVDQLAERRDETIAEILEIGLPETTDLDHLVASLKRENSSTVIAMSDSEQALLVSRVYLLGDRILELESTR